MVTVGIDSGNQNTKVVVLRDREVIGRASRPTEFDAAGAAHAACGGALEAAGIAPGEVEYITATGAGRAMVDFADSAINEIASASRGIRAVLPDTALVIDMGAEGCKGIRLKPDGRVEKYEVNDKCASGAGMFIETMARALQIEVEEIGPYSLRHTKEVPMNAQCVVFAESEVISLIHQQESKEDIAYGIHVGISNRVGALVRRVGIVDGIALIGGPGNNVGLVRCLGDELAKVIAVPDKPEYVSAIGAAHHAAQQLAGATTGGRAV